MSVSGRLSSDAVKISTTCPMIVPTFAKSSVNFMQPIIGITSPIDRITIRTNFSGANVPAFNNIPPIGSTYRSVAGIIFMASVK